MTTRYPENVLFLWSLLKETISVFASNKSRLLIETSGLTPEVFIYFYLFKLIITEYSFLIRNFILIYLDINAKNDR